MLENISNAGEQFQYWRTILKLENDFNAGDSPNAGELLVYTA